MYVCVKVLCVCYCGNQMYKLVKSLISVHYCDYSVYLFMKIVSLLLWESGIHRYLYCMVCATVVIRCTCLFPCNQLCIKMLPGHDCGTDVHVTALQRELKAWWRRRCQPYRLYSNCLHYNLYSASITPMSR